MMSVVSQEQGNKPDRPFLSAVTSLNTQRRNDALYLLARDYATTLTPYEVCKTQVLSDVFHVVQTGTVIFGGVLYAMPFGPVVERMAFECKRWATSLVMAGMLARPIPHDPRPLERVDWCGKEKDIPVFRASNDYARREQATWEWFSADEEANIRRAYEKVAGMKNNWLQSQAYFHEPISAIGYAYDLATRALAKPFKSPVEMNLFDVLDGAERIEKLDVSYARAMLGLWVQDT